MPEKKPKGQRKLSYNTEIIEEDIVRLKPIAGIRPGIYLAFIYGLAILIVLFFVLLFPGLSNPGTVLVVRSEPAGAAIRIDGVFMDAAPCEIFVPKGRHQIEAVLPGFTDWNGQMELDGRLFASLFFPAKVMLQVTLQSPNPAQAFIDEAAEYAAWTFAGEPYSAYQIPMTLSEAAYRFGPEAADPLVRQSMEQTLAASAAFAHTRSGLRDLVRAKFLLDNEGLAASPLSLLNSLEDIIGFLNENPGAAAWLGETLSGEAASVVKNSDWYRRTQSSAFAESSFGAVIDSGGLRFREITVHADGQNPAANFYIAEDVVPLQLWQLFLSERPQWSKDNLDSLVRDGLVDSQYLAFLDFPGQPENTASWVSWYAAKAWCEWYNTKINAGDFVLDGNIAAQLRLPTETEWELAVRAGLANTGELWEWCDNAFAPVAFLSAQVSTDLLSPQKAVRGGSWVNAQNTVNAETRGSLLPDSCSPFVSFRPVISVKRN